MSLRSRWNRVHAEHWAHRLLATQTFVLALSTLWAVANGLAHGFLFLALVPATFMGLSAWLTVAWRKERRWAWWVATILFGMRFAANVLGLLVGEVSWLTVAFLIFDGLLLAYLFHPAARARIDRPVAAVVGAETGTTATRLDPRG